MKAPLNRRVFVIGYAAATPLGLSLDATFDRYAAGEAGFRPLTRCSVESPQPMIVGEIPGWNAHDLDFMDEGTQRRPGEGNSAVDPEVRFPVAGKGHERGHLGLVQRTLARQPVGIEGHCRYPADADAAGLSVDGGFIEAASQRIRAENFRNLMELKHSFYPLFITAVCQSPVRGNVSLIFKILSTPAIKSIG